MQTKDQLKRGRPSHYSAEIADTICNRLAGGESLRAICADAGCPPLWLSSRLTVEGERPSSLAIDRAD